MTAPLVDRDRRPLGLGQVQRLAAVARAPRASATSTPAPCTARSPGGAWSRASTSTTRMPWPPPRAISRSTIGTDPAAPRCRSAARDVDEAIRPTGSRRPSPRSPPTSRSAPSCSSCQRDLMRGSRRADRRGGGRGPRHHHGRRAGRRRADPAHGQRGGPAAAPLAELHGAPTPRRSTRPATRSCAATATTRRSRSSPRPPRASSRSTPPTSTSREGRGRARRGRRETSESRRSARSGSAAAVRSGPGEPGLGTPSAAPRRAALRRPGHRPRERAGRRPGRCSPRTTPASSTARSCSRWRRARPLRARQEFEGLVGLAAALERPDPDRPGPRRPAALGQALRGARPRRRRSASSPRAAGARRRRRGRQGRRLARAAVRAAVVPAACLGTRRTGDLAASWPRLRSRLVVDFGPPVALDLPDGLPGRARLDLATGRSAPRWWRTCTRRTVRSRHPAADRTATRDCRD